MMKEMTHGKPFPLIMGFFLPMLLGNVFQQLYNMADTVIVGKFLNVNALAAVGSTGSVSFLVIGFVIGITSGSCILPAQAFGAGNMAEMRRMVANAIYICGAAAIIITALATSLTMPLLRLMQTPEEIIGQAFDYIIVINGGICVTIAYNLLAGILRAMGDSRSPLYFLILSSIINIILDLVFIIIFGMGVEGAGYATVIAQAISALLCFVYIRKNFPVLRFQKGEFAFSRILFFRILKISIPMALQFSITAVGSIIVQSAVNSLGTIAVAAVTAAYRLQFIVIQPMETLGVTMATYSGQNLGAGRFDRIKTGMRQALLTSMAYCFTVLLLMWFFGGSMCLLFVDAKETAVIADATYFLQTSCLFYPILGLLFLYRNMLQGVGYSFLPMMAGVSELVARAVVAFGFVGIFGFTAIVMASPAAWVAATALLVVTYLRKMKELGKRFPVADVQKEI